MDSYHRRALGLQLPMSPLSILQMQLAVASLWGSEDSIQVGTWESLSDASFQSGLLFLCSLEPRAWLMWGA